MTVRRRVRCARYRFAPVTDVKVLADCTYPMSLRSEAVEVNEEDTENVEAGGKEGTEEEGRVRRERKTDPRSNHPPKIKFSFPSVLRLLLPLHPSLSLSTSSSFVSPPARPSSSISTHKNATTVPFQPRSYPATGPETREEEIDDTVPSKVTKVTEGNRRSEDCPFPTSI